MNQNKFWEVIDYARNQSAGNLAIQEQAIIQQLVNYSAEEIISFEINLRQALNEADDFGVMAAQKIFQGWVTDDSYLYFRCWLISQGKTTFEATLVNPEVLTDIVTDGTDTSFEELLCVATEAYIQNTGKEEEDDTFPRNVAVENTEMLDYDMGGAGTKGEDWHSDELPVRYPKLCAMFKLQPGLLDDPKAALQAMLTRFTTHPALSDEENKTIQDFIKKMNNGNNKS